uniref:Uncharacterized protein n=1 Tax=Anguilla anguilla TaxID=7936 RepID=A0A0E9S5A7_ANGAN
MNGTISGIFVSLCTAHIGVNKITCNFPTIKSHRRQSLF